MCGIFGYIGKRSDAQKLALESLKKLEYRGYDSWGIAASDGKITIKKRTGKIGDADVSDMPGSNFVLGHTRWATHGGVTEANAHPHLDSSGRLAIIHNGIIENYDELKKELLILGHRFLSETDTEVAVHHIEENLKKLKQKHTGKKPKEMFLEAVRTTFNRFEGMSAIVVLDSETSTFVAVKSGSPLVIGKGKGENFLASDAHPILSYTKQIYFMEDGDIALISKDDIAVFYAETGKKKEIRFATIDWIIQTDTDKGNYAHYMLKEIMDQPTVIENIVSSSDQAIDQFSRIITQSFGSYLVGCGTAAYACLAGTYIFSKIAKRHINFSVGSEFGYLIDFLTPKSLVLALSQSGETIDVIDAVKKAKQKGASIAAFVNVLGSTLYRIADHKLLLGAGVEKAVVSTKAFTAKLAYLILLAHTIAEKSDEGKTMIKHCIKELQAILQEESLVRIQKLVKLLKEKEHIYIIGRGMSYPIALESALKIKEASYIHAEGFAAGELKHGVIALIENGTPCIVYIPNDETYGATLAGAMEMKARGGFIIGISYKPHDVFDVYLPVADCGIATAIPAVVVSQLLGYYLAVARGVDPDKPRNLAKSVTVK